MSTVPNQLNWKSGTLLAVCAMASFHLAYALPACSPLILVFLFCIFRLRNVASSRKAFYMGLAIGMLLYAPQLAFFWKLFGPPATALWLVLAFWLGSFLLLAHLCEKRFG